MTKRIALAVLVTVAALLIYRRHSDYHAALKDEEEAHRYSVIEAGPSSTPTYHAYLLRKEMEFFEDLEAERYAQKALADHLRQIKDGTLEGVQAGRLCWYCKEHDPKVPCESRNVVTIR